MSKSLTKGGLILSGVGVILVIVGLIIFFSVFFSMGDSLNSSFNTSLPFSSGFHSPSGFGATYSTLFVRAAIGVLLTGVGGIFVKVGLGASVIGSSGKIADWIRRLIHGDENNKASGKNCPNCNNTIDSGAVYCSHCGNRL